MKKETKELMWLFCIAILVMVALPLVYRGYAYFCPPKEKPRQTLTGFLKEAKSARGIKLLTKPISKWSDDESKSEPEIYAWLKEQDVTILPWEWTEEARRKDPKGYAKCWRRIWESRKSHCDKLFAEQQKEIKQLNQELQILTTIHTHRTNQIARLRAFPATNSFPCKVALERLEKGRFWGWNKKVEVVECSNLAAIMASTNSICSKEVATARDELKGSCALTDAIVSSKERSIMCEKLCEICDRCIRLIENESSSDELLLKSLVENLGKASVCEK